eukprot:COSAG01_NODE_51255_length_356_cov_0.805447_2_plen_62_part_01
MCICDMNGCVHNNVSCVSSQLSRLLLYGAIAFVPYIHAHMVIWNDRTIAFILAFSLACQLDL